jgi:peroxiredoxin Q/BCP
MLGVGEAMPSFTGTLSDGMPWSSDAARGRPLVLFFYPRDFTSVCTREAAAFRDAYDGLRGLGAELIGVSRDSVKRHARFKAEQCLPFPLLSDADGRLTKIFGVSRLWGLFRLVKRVTFVADGAGVIRAVLHHELDVDFHIQGVRACLESLKTS